MIKLGKKSGTGEKKKQIKVKVLGKEQNAIAYMPYGMFANVPNDNIVLLLNQDGYEDSYFALQMDLSNIDQLQDKEIAIGIPTKQGRLLFKVNSVVLTDDNNNKIEMKSGKIALTGTAIDMLNANESFVKGDTFMTQLDVFLQVLSNITPGTTAQNAAALSAIKAAAIAFDAQIATFKSTTIKGS